MYRGSLCSLHKPKCISKKKKGKVFLTQSSALLTNLNIWISRRQTFCQYIQCILYTVEKVYTCAATYLSMELPGLDFS